MAYYHPNFAELAESKGFTLWRYATPDSPRDVESFGYFSWECPADVGDLVIVGCTQNLDVVATGMLVCTRGGPQPAFQRFGEWVLPDEDCHSQATRTA